MLDAPPPIVDPNDVVAPPTMLNAPEPMRVSSAVEQVEGQLIKQAMVRFNGNKKRVAAELGISRSYLYKRLAQIGLATESDALRSLVHDHCVSSRLCDFSC
jgi:DNA-binding NtrC family response regulator